MIAQDAALAARLDAEWREADRREIAARMVMPAAYGERELNWGAARAERVRRQAEARAAAAEARAARLAAAAEETDSDDAAAPFAWEQPAEPVAWALATHRMGARRHLTADDPRAETPEDFRCELYAPQKTVLAAMVALETSGSLAVHADNAPPEWAPRLETRVAQFAACFSFGKTLTTLALVVARRGAAPAPQPVRMPRVSHPGSDGPTSQVYDVTPRGTVTLTTRAGAPGSQYSYRAYAPEAAAVYAATLPLTVVLAASSVITQWEAHAQNLTTLRHVTIDGVASLRAFATQFRATRAAGVDVVFVKAGRVTKSFALAGEPPSERSDRSLVGALKAVLEGYAVARFVVDDFDTLRLASDDPYLPASFTWLISATRRSGATQPRLAVDTTVVDYFRREASRPITCASHDGLLGSTLSLQCDPDYVAEYVNTTVPQFRRVRVRGGVAAAMLRDLGANDAIVEMLNAGAVGEAAQQLGGGGGGDAVGAAAAELGIGAATIADVVGRVVGGQLGALRAAARARDRAAAARDAWAGCLSNAAPAAVLRHLRYAIRAADDGAYVGVLAAAATTPWAPDDGGSASDVAAAGDHDRRTLGDELLAAEAWAATTTEQHGKTLNRMRDNIREGECQCCTVPFEAGERGAAYILASCCQVVVCEPCITRPRLGGRGREVLPRCPNCAAAVAPPYSRALIRVGAELDLDAALDDRTLLESGDTPPASRTPPPGAAPAPAGPVALGRAGSPPPPPPAPPANLKIAALLDIVRGVPVQNCLSDGAAEPFVRGLLAGRAVVPWPATSPRKILVFTMYAESTERIRVELERAAVPHVVLRGTRANRDAAVATLRGPATVMLVTSANDCAGLHLPFLSHVVLFHRVRDTAVEQQVAARGQRLGRTANLEIVSIVNEVE